jgi:hypothetical protein
MLRESPDAQLEHARRCLAQAQLEHVTVARLIWQSRVRALAAEMGVHADEYEVPVDPGPAPPRQVQAVA